MPITITDLIPKDQIDIPVNTCIEKYLCDEKIKHKQDIATVIMMKLFHQLSERHKCSIQLIYKSPRNQPNLFYLAFRVGVGIQTKDIENCGEKTELALLTICHLMGFNQEEEFLKLKGYVHSHKTNSEIKFSTGTDTMLVLMKNLFNIILPQVVRDDKAMIWYEEVIKYETDDQNQVIELGEGGYGVVKKAQIKRNNEIESVAIKTFLPKKHCKLRFIQTYYGFSQRYERTCLKLERSWETISAFFKPERETVCVVPTHFIVEETIENKNDKWCVPHAKFKEWIKEKFEVRVNPDLKICGYIFPIARGRNLASCLDENDSEDSTNLQKEDLYKITCGLINAIIQLSNHGFIHGDISPQNIFYHPQTEEENDNHIQLIDFSGAVKMPKCRNCEEQRMLRMFSKRFDIIYNKVYMHPNILLCDGSYNENILGFEQDVFCVATTLMRIYSVVENLSDEYDIEDLHKQYVQKDHYQDRISTIKDYFNQLPESENLCEIKKIIISLVDYALNRNTPINMEQKDAHHARLRAILAPIAAPIGITEATEA